MLEKLIWKNVFLSEDIKRNIVSFYENTALHFQNKSLLNSDTLLPYNYNKNYSLKEKTVNFICKKIHNHWLRKTNLNNSIIEMPHVWQYMHYKEIPMLFGLLLAKEQKVEKFKKLIDWGLNIHKIYMINGVRYNLAQQILWAYHEKLLLLEETIELLNVLSEQGVDLLDKNYLISHYEKALSLKKLETTDSINAESLLLKQKTIDTVFGWIDKHLYHYLINSHLSQHTKTLLEYIKLKQEVQQVYIEKFAGNIRTLDEEVIAKKLFNIEDIIKRQHIFNSQSSIYNSLLLLFNLPEFTEKISHYVVAECYNAFNTLNSKAKRFLLGNLINKSKEIVLMNLLYQDIDMKWIIKTDKGENLLGLALLANTELTEYIVTHENFELLRSNNKGDNILHTLESLPFNECIIKDKLKKKINHLNVLEKMFLFSQVNENNYTPLIKAIKERNIFMVELLLELGASGIEEIEGVSETYKSALNFIVSELNVTSQHNNINNIEQISGEKEDWLYMLYKNWTIEKNFKNITKKLNGIKTKEKVFKI